MEDPRLVARLHWKEGRPKLAAQKLLAGIPAERRARWAIRILKVCGDAIGAPPAVTVLCDLYEKRDEWPSAKEHFRTLRELTLARERGKFLRHRRRIRSVRRPRDLLIDIRSRHIWMNRNNRVIARRESGEAIQNARRETGLLR